MNVLHPQRDEDTGFVTIVDSRQCCHRRDLGYQIYATVGAFYVPLTLMIVIYCRIYMVSTRLAMSESRSRHSTVSRTVPLFLFSE